MQQQHLFLEYKSAHKSLQDIDVKKGFRMKNLMELFPIECNRALIVQFFGVHFFILVQALQCMYWLIAIEEVIRTSMALEFHSKQL